MKIYYLIHSLSGAGTTRQADLVCRELRALGVDITLLVGSALGVNTDHFDKTSYPVIHLARKKLSYGGFVIRLTRFLKKNPDCLLLSGAKRVNIKAIDADRLSRHKGPLILTLTNNIAQFSTQSGKSKKKSQKNHYKKYHHADRILVISQGMKSELENNGFKPDQLVFCPPPIDVSDILKQAAEPIDHAWLQEDRGVRQIPVILSVGRWDPQKNFPLLIRAFAKARKNRNVRLIIMGSGDSKELLQYKLLAKTLGVAADIEFAGFQKNPFSLMAKTDLFALSSDWEGFGLVLAEALVCGSPVISTDCPHGPSEILTGTEFTALTPVGDADAFAASMLRLLEKPPKMTGKNIELMQPYDVQPIAQRYKALIDDILRN